MQTTASVKAATVNCKVKKERDKKEELSEFQKGRSSSQISQGLHKELETYWSGYLVEKKF